MWSLGPAQRSTDHQPSPGPPTENQPARQGRFSLVGGGQGGVLFHGGDITGLEGGLGGAKSSWRYKGIEAPSCSRQVGSGSRRP